MNFTLFGIDVEIEAGFWFTTILLGFNLVDTSRGVAGILPLLVWMLVVFVSVLVHEFGHAFAIRRHRIQPEIVLYMMGGKTMWRPVLPVSRFEHIIISLAGPFAGFFLAAIIYGIQFLVPNLVARLPELAKDAFFYLKWVNFSWGIINLIPVSPLDGGHVLEQALGPKRVRLAAGISALVGFGVAIYALRIHSYWMAIIFGMSAFQSLRVLQAGGMNIDESDLRPRAPVTEDEPIISSEISSILHTARKALADDNTAQAQVLCDELLARDPGAENAPPPNAKREAYEILSWVALAAEDLDVATTNLEEAKKLGDVDPALAGAVHFAKREINPARRVLEAARARGDDRKEVVGPLIQILIEQGEVARAAAIAYDIVDALSEDDARRMAQLAFEHDAFDWAARLYETVFNRESQAEDAYEAARAHAQDGAYDRATDMLRRAVAAGFNDRTRAWSDKSLEALRARDALEALVPRP